MPSTYLLMERKMGSFIVLKKEKLSGTFENSDSHFKRARKNPFEENTLQLEDEVDYDIFIEVDSDRDSDSDSEIDID